MNPKVSIIIPVYNAERCIERCIKSLLNQTFRNIEIIIIDDGSTDKTALICDHIKQLDSRVSVWHKKNNGVSSARNYGIEKACADYIMFVDADDYVEDVYCEELYKSVQENDADLVICGYRNIYDDKGRYIDILPKNVEPLSENTIRQMFNTSFINMPWAKLYKSAFIRSLFNINRSMGEDFEFNIKYIEGINKIAVVSKVLYNYDTSSNSGLTSNKSQILSAITMDYLLVDNFLKKRNIAYNSIDFLYGRIKSYLKISGRETYRSFIRCVTEINRNIELHNLMKKYNGHTAVDKVIRFLILGKHYGILYLLIKGK